MHFWRRQSQVVNLKAFATTYVFYDICKFGYTQVYKYILYISYPYGQFTS